MTSTNTTEVTLERGSSHAGYEQPELEFSRELTHLERFEKFDQENPHVYETLVRLAREWVTSTGSDNAGIALLFEVARWQIAMKTNDPDYKINNNHKTFYSRKIMRQEPDLAGLFRIRHSDEGNRYDALLKHGIAA